MNDCMTNPAPTAGTDIERIPEITRILTTAEEAQQRFSVPADFSQRDKVLYAAHPTCFAPPIEDIERLSERHDLDIVLAGYNPDPLAAAALTFSIGVRLWWKILWHHDFRLWRPDDAGLACFVPSDPSVRMHFVIDDGRLQAWEGEPFRDADDRRLGLDQADAAVRAMLKRGR